MIKNEMTSDQYLTKYIEYYRNSGVDVERNWYSGLCLEKKLCEHRLFYFIKYVLNDGTPENKNLFDDDYHWRQVNFAHCDIHWCDNCMFLEKYVNRDKSYSYRCGSNGKPACPFLTCDNFRGLHGETGKQHSFSKMPLHPRESLKTTNLVIGYILWCWIKDLNYTFLLLTETDPLALESLQSICKHLEENAKLRKNWPYLYRAFVHAKPNKQDMLKLRRPDYRRREPSIYCAGIMNSVQGFHFDEILYDDITGQTNATGAKAVTAEEMYNSSHPLGMKIFPKKRMTATPYAQDDLTCKLRDSGLWDVAAEENELFYILDEKGKFKFGGKNYRQVSLGDCRRFIELNEIPDEIYIPYKVGWDKHKILDKIKTYKDSLFQYFCQYHIRPEGDPTKGFLKQWIVHMTEEQIAKDFYAGIQQPGHDPYVPWDIMHTYMCIDLSSSEDQTKRNVSETAFIIWSVDCFDRYYLRYTWIGNESPFQSVNRALDLIEQYRPLIYTVEKGGGWNWFRPYLLAEGDRRELAAAAKKKEYYRPGFFEVPRGGARADKKEDRIIKALQPMYEMNSRPRMPIKVIHVGDRQTHRKFDESLMRVGESRKNKKIDGPDAAADIVVVATLPDETLFLGRLEEKRVRGPELDAASQWANKMLEETFEEIRRDQNIDKYGVPEFEMSEDFYYD